MGWRWEGSWGLESVDILKAPPLDRGTPSTGKELRKTTSRSSSSRADLLPRERKVALGDLSVGWDVMQSSKLHNGVLLLRAIKVVIPSHIGHAVMVQQG